MPPRDTSAANAARRRKPEQRRTFADDLASGIRELLERDSRITFPSSKYRNDPVGFARDILGIDPWSRQCDLLRAVAKS